MKNHKASLSVSLFGWGATYWQLAGILPAVVWALLLSIALPLNAAAQKSGAHVPAAGTAERKAITDGLRGDQKVVFKIYLLESSW
jgi:hypothetical protein